MDRRSSEVLAPPALATGAVFHERYEVQRCIASGGMGAIYEVVHTVTGQRCALKVMLSALINDDDMRERFAREARVTANVQSEHVVTVFDAGVDEASAVPFLVMELLQGSDLAQILREEGQLEPAYVLTLLRQAAMALDKT
ncbi:MAG: protein kinase, partial [Polyangiaceae bacterium]